MYYHIMIEVENSATKKGQSSTVSHEEYNYTDKNTIFENILHPYLRNEEFQFSGYFLKRDGIKRLVVFESEFNSNQITERANSRIPDGVIYFIGEKDSVFHFSGSNLDSKDITRIILNEAKETLGSKVKLEEKEQKQINAIDRKKVFIVHGQDDSARLEVAVFLNKLGLEPIVLHEQASSGSTIIEKIEEYTNVGFGVVLYTPCDIGAKQSNNPEYKPRARQNVVFEHGYLIGKLSRKNVCALVKGVVETPNDISGVVYVSQDAAGAWKLMLAKELIKSGYEIDMNKAL
ncbi:Predicted nucleotide-binding protein containing TIR-like domain [Yersinia enterocolitica]|uniref:TIR domain-containing protein n=1 Tax=Yersinia enterocolitica TaxID=630 RepID=UPI0005E57F69|nr:nucleotide-binding protein [Yersinia enterocolitica]EKN5087777.1 DNA-binding protein [Yersinia enterocolitica]EKN6369185.1 DNA-binding protein [Yersinia enterocolitica]CQH07077.1 Predicted nucleotide-binding protein containing TIR-like domain [Yersinia enterocolitica]